MLDDLIIFTLAAVTLQTTLGSTYARYGKVAGGIVRILLGAILLLAPEMLR